MKELNMKNTNQTNRNKLLKYISIPALVGIIAGAIAGYIYYIEIGCASGTCPLTSNPYLSILWGAVIGYLFGDMFTRKKGLKEELAKDDPVVKP